MIQLAKILNTFHCLRHKTWAHGNLTPHNVFIHLPENLQDFEHEIRVQVDGIELTDLKKYANMFYNYKAASVWSAPEVLKTPKKILEPLTPMDVYSFAFIMWELFHEQVPFDGDIVATTRYVTKEDVRPRIEEENDDDDEEDDEEAPAKISCSEPMAKLIRKCWTSDPVERPNLNWVIEELMKEISFYGKQNG